MFSKNSSIIQDIFSESFNGTVVPLNGMTVPLSDTTVPLNDFKNCFAISIEMPSRNKGIFPALMNKMFCMVVVLMVGQSFSGR
ncbi:MAG: hypothetical protein K6E54_03130 [Bacteroidaceae bacterium]|nr:hypothetical protein [Bacteroidaceae bacterium]